MKRVVQLITLEFFRNWKQPRQWLTVLLFLMAVSLVLYMSFRRMRPETWAVMYWVVMLFLAVNATLGDDSETSYKERYFYNLLALPGEMYISKVIYNSIVLVVLSFILYTVFGVFFQWHVSFGWEVMVILIAGALSLSSVFCFVSALVRAASQGSVLASLLGFPLVIPIILLLIRMFMVEMGFITSDGFAWEDLASLLGIDALLTGLGVLLYPLIWRS